MNLAESLKHVLKHKTKNIFSDFWNYDFKVILLNLTQDISELVKAGLKVSFKDIVLIVNVLPKRVKEAFSIFRDDFLEELEKQTDPKQKTLFGLKVIGALTSFALGAVYDIRRGKTSFAFRGVRRHSALTKFIVAELVFKITQHFIYRFLHELEQELTDPEDLKTIQYFKELVSTRPDIENEKDLIDEIPSGDGDP